jgi:glycosyltransferase involved in cell wall biosynthesis
LPVPRAGSAQGLRVLVVTNVRQPILEAYVSPLAALDEVAEVVIVRDRADVELGRKVRVAASPRWWPRTIVTKLVSRAYLLRREVARRRPDVMMTVHWFPDGPGVLRLARRLGVPVVANIIGGRAELTDGGRRVALTRLPRAFKRWAQGYQRDQLNATAVISCTGSATCNWLRAAGVNQPKLMTLHAAIDCAWLRDDAGPRDIDVAYVGRADPDKRIDRLLKVLAAVAERRPGTRVAIVSLTEAQLAEYKELVTARAALGAGLNVLGRVERVNDVLTRAKVLLLTSDTEGRTLAVLESMACGAVPVVTEVGDLTEALDEGRAGVIVPLQGSEETVVVALADAVVALLRDESRRHALAARGWDYVRREHDPSRTREEWRAVIRHALASTGGPCASS